MSGRREQKNLLPPGGAGHFGHYHISDEKIDGFASWDHVTTLPRRSCSMTLYPLLPQRTRAETGAPHPRPPTTIVPAPSGSRAASSTPAGRSGPPPPAPGAGPPPRGPVFPAAAALSA